MSKRKKEMRAKWEKVFIDYKAEEIETDRADGE